MGAGSYLPAPSREAAAPARPARAGRRRSGDFERRGRTARGVESSGLARSSARRSSDPSPPKPRRRKRRSKAWNVVWGIVFFILGVIGILIPVLPQIPFFLMSLFFFSLVFPPLRRWVRRFLHR